MDRVCKKMKIVKQQYFNLTRNQRCHELQYLNPISHNERWGFLLDKD